MGFLNKFFGDANEKYIKSINPLVEKINSFEPDFEKLSDAQLKSKTREFKEKIGGGSPSHTLDELLPEAFALAREAAKRTLNQRHFDVQLIGGIVLHQGKIAEMKTGEGKTLAATLPIYLNALKGKGVHVITVNDYLAKRDVVWMGQIYDALGLSVGCIVHETAYIYDPNYQVEVSDPDISEKERDKKRDIIGGFKVVESYLRPCSRQEAYGADITYGTNNEFAFDYLKDNMVYDLSQKVQRGFNFAIVDEVDSILIDEARTPLIISSPVEEPTDKYYFFSKIVKGLKKDEDFILEEKDKAVTFTEQGQDKIVKALGKDPWADNDIATTHQLEAALKAKILFEKDKHYVISEGEIIIVDEFTGRLMPGRRWSGGLHQAVEAKEGVQVKQESRTFASITFQNYFRLYKKLAGMTGTATTSAEEFDKVYKLDVVVIPTNNTLIRKELSDKIYKTEQGKVKAVLEEIKKCYQKGQPVLVGTVSIEKNEYLGKLLEREGIKHQILNAKNHQKEGEIIAQAGRAGAVTIATNMAGRGVDIVLGGVPVNKEEQKKVKEFGGLLVIGTERHEARRIDNQLRGRAGRQGDPGASQFFVSLEDDLMRVFGGDRIKRLMETLRLPEDQPIEARMISKAIESAQTKVEGMNFDIRKHVLEYDDVMSKHREIFYKKRKEVLEKFQKSQLSPQIIEIIEKAGFSQQDYEKRKQEIGQENIKNVEKDVCLKVMDILWIEHLEAMSYLMDSVRLRAYGQQDPLVEYKREGHRMFQELLQKSDQSIANALMKAEIKVREPVRPFQSFDQAKNSSWSGWTGKPIENTPQTSGGVKAKAGRNDPCPCGSGKKYKKCCGK